MTAEEYAERADAFPPAPTTEELIERVEAKTPDKPVHVDEKTKILLLKADALGDIATREFPPMS